MLLKPFLIEKAAECDRRMRQSADERERFALKVIHEMWMTLVNESASAPAQLLNEIAAIEEIQSVLNGC